MLASSPSMAQRTVWVRTTSGVPSYGITEGRAIATFGSGGAIVAGSTVTTDPSPQAAPSTIPGQTNSGGADAFVRRYDSYGNVVWTRQFGTTGDDGALSVATDIAGDAFVGGETASQSVEIFVRKFDPDGNVLWSRQYAALPNDLLIRVLVDAGGDVYAISSSSVHKLNGSSGADLLSFIPPQWAADAGVDAGGNLYVASVSSLTKFSPSGERIFEVTFPAGWEPRVAIGNGRVYVDDKRSKGVAKQTSGFITRDMTDYLRGYSLSGQFLFERSVGAINANSMAADRAGNVYLFGTVGGEGVNFPPLVFEVFDLIELGEQNPPPDALLEKVDADGHEIWRQRFHGTDRTDGMGVSAADRVYVSGLSWVSGPGVQGCCGVGVAFVAQVDETPSCWDTPNHTGQESGKVSRPIHNQVEPDAGILEAPLHKVNCAVVVRVGL